MKKYYILETLKLDEDGKKFVDKNIIAKAYAFDKICLQELKDDNDILKFKIYEVKVSEKLAALYNGEDLEKAFDASIMIQNQANKKLIYFGG